jgi:hypothetical protein
MVTTTTPTTPQTFLEAINMLLREVRIKPIHSLQAAENDTDAAGAKKALDDVAREVLTRGWQFNTNFGLVLLPDTDGTVPLPNNALKVTKVKYTSDDRRLYVRGRKIYDNRNNTFTLNASVTVDCVIGLPFEDFPEPIKAWVVALAASRWCRSKLPSGAVFQYTAEFLNKCEQDALEYEVEELGTETLKDTSPHFGYMGRRNI